MGAILNGETGEVMVLDDEVRETLRQVVGGMGVEIALGTLAVRSSASESEASELGREVNKMMFTASMLTAASLLPDGTRLDMANIKLPTSQANMLKQMPPAYKPDGWDALIDSVTDVEVSVEDVDEFLANLFGPDPAV